MHLNRRQGPVRLIHRHPLEAQRVIHADFAGGGWWCVCAGGVAWLQEQLGAELLRPAGRVALDPEGLKPHRELGLAAAVEQLEFVAGGEETLQPLTGQRTPGGPHHQHHQAGVHQKRAHPAAGAAAGRQAMGLGLHLPAPLAEQLLQPVEFLIGIAAVQGFRQVELAQLARAAVVDPAQRRLQGRPLPPPAAEDQRQPQPGQQR